MASIPPPQIIFILSFITILLSISSVHSFHFDVGNFKGWVVPPKNDTKFYDEWASKNRFLVLDTLRFRYKKDSVMEVTEKEFKNCKSTRPISFSNNGNTMIELGRSGLFYFISGASGHCQRGQKMVVKVMSPEEVDRDDGNNRSSSPSSSSSNIVSCFGGAAAMLHLVLFSYLTY